MEIKIAIKVGGNDPIEIKVDIPEKGEAKVGKETTDVSCYAKWFDENAIGWTKYPESNNVFLIQQIEAANFMLKKQGHLFLNEVYDMLGIPRTMAGQLAGWLYAPDDPNRHNYVDFGLYDDRNADFINCRTNKALLEFNVDGNILEDL